MAHANPYAPGQVETLEQARNELVKLADTVNQILDNQKLVQRDDGCLMDCAVVPHTLSDEVVRMIGHFELMGAYAARPYQKGQVVTYQNRMYVCAAAHHGGAVMDMAQWRLLGKAGCGALTGDYLPVNWAESFFADDADGLTAAGVYVLADNGEASYLVVLGNGENVGQLRITPAGLRVRFQTASGWGEWVDLSKADDVKLPMATSEQAGIVLLENDYKSKKTAAASLVALSALEMDLKTFTRSEIIKGASLMGFQQEGTGAVPRTMLDKARDVIHLRDYATLQDAVDDAVASDVGFIELADTPLTVSTEVDMQGIGFRGQQTVINNTSNLSNAGPIRDCIVRGYPSDVDYISPLSFGGLHKKVVFGDSATIMSFIIKRRGRGYIKCEHWFNNFGTGGMDTAVACENWRGTVARYMSEVYLYRHTSAATAGTWSGSLPMLVSVSFPTGTAAGGRAVKYREGSSAGATIDYTVTANTVGQRGMAAIYCTSGSTPSADLLVNGTVQRNFSCVRATTGVDILMVEYTCTRIGANTIQLRNNTEGTQVLCVIGVEFSTLENYTAGDVDEVAFGDYDKDYLPSNGANDYAFLSTATGKFFGSVHGGETQRVAPELLLDGVNVGIPAAGAFFIGENIQLRQRTTMADGAGGSLDVESNYTYYEDSAQKLDVFMIGSATVTTAYTAMSTTSSRFTLVSYPEFKALTNGTHLFGRHNVISQLNRADPAFPCKLTTAFTLHPMGGRTGANMGANGAYILAGNTYKVYYGPVMNSPTTLTKLSFNTTRLFE